MPNRTLCRLKGVAKELPVAGSPFYSNEGTEAGVLTSIAATQENAFVALGYVKRGQNAQWFITERGVRLDRA